MAPKTKSRPVAHQAGASDSEDDLMTAAASRAQPNKVKTQRNALKVAETTTMPAAKKVTKRKAVPKQPRQALKDRTNIQYASDEEDVADWDDDAAVAKPKAKRAKTSSTKTTAAAKKGREPTTMIEPPMGTIPETQFDQEPMEEDVEQSIEIDEVNMDISREPSPPRLQRQTSRATSVQPQPSMSRASARPASVQPTYAPIRERSGSASAAERRGGDPELRRKLNEMTKKYENLQMKHDNLEAIGKNDAESNFEKLKRASDQKSKDANDLIAALKKELAELKKSSSSASSETAGLQKQVAALTSANEKVTAERDSTKAQRDDLKSKLQESQNEVKSLEVKLVAARQQISISAQEAKAQEMAAKNQPRTTVPASNEALKEAKMKENLYADVTGLIIRAVKRKDGEDEYDCIQTGRNGTLHFHLSVGNDASTPHPKTPSGLSYEEAEFAYEPLLDENRDRDLLDLLPDYLTEEICFPRNHAQRFYTKLMDSMTKKIVVEED